MKLEKLSPCEMLKLSISLSLILVENYSESEINSIKILLNSILNNLSCYYAQKCNNKPSNKK